MNDSTSPSILVIDNDDDVARAIEVRLEQHGYVCTTESSGAQAIGLFDEGGFDLVITDLNMPAGDGMAVVEAIRRIGTTPIIVVTGFHEHYRTQLDAVEGISWLQKPFDHEVLLDLVETELAMRRV